MGGEDQHLDDEIKMIVALGEDSGEAETRPEEVIDEEILSFLDTHCPEAEKVQRPEPTKSSGDPILASTSFQ